MRAYLTLFSDVLTQPSKLAAIPLKPFFADRNQLRQSFFTKHAFRQAPDDVGRFKSPRKWIAKCGSAQEKKFYIHL